METEPASAFAAFREAVFDDFHLLMRLRSSRDRDAYVALVVAIGAERGFVFDGATVRAGLRKGELTWLMQSGETA